MLSRSARGESPWHGDAHWRCVAATGLALGEAIQGADLRLAFLFGLLHDTRRENEHRDPEHGPRAAAFVRELHGEGVLQVSERELELLARAVEVHSDGHVTDEPTTAVCWDADRLHLPRVGITPDPARFSTGLARTEEWATRAARLREQPPSWDELVVLLVRGPIPQSYRVAKRLFAGEYPGAEDEVEARQRLAAFAGVDVFVDLSHEADGLPPYEQLLAGGVRRSAIPVPDFSVPTEETLVRALDAIDESVAAGRTVYVHCWGGIGRTGTIVGCWLARHGASGEEALRRLAELHGATPNGWRQSPETDAQRAVVREWPPGR